MSLSKTTHLMDVLGSAKVNAKIMLQPLQLVSLAFVKITYR